LKRDSVVPLPTADYCAWQSVDGKLV